MIRTTVLLGAAFIVAACGGGGGGGGSDSDSQKNSEDSVELARITSAKLPVITNAVLETLPEVNRGAAYTQKFLRDFVVGFQLGVGQAPLSASSSSLAAESGLYGAAGLLALDAVPAEQLITASAVDSLTDGCSRGGSFTTEFDLNVDSLSRGYFSPGDYVYSSWSDCSESRTYADGDIGFNILESRGSASRSGWEGLIAFDFDKFRARESSDSYFFDGGYNLKVGDTYNRPYRQITGSRIKVGRGRYEIRNFDLKFDFFTHSDPDRRVNTTGVMVLADDYDLGGEIRINFVEPLVRFRDDNNPSEGLIRIKGANGTRALIEVESAYSVTVSLDTNGDGEFNQVTPYLWHELLGQQQREPALNAGNAENVARSMLQTAQRFLVFADFAPYLVGRAEELDFTSFSDSVACAGDGNINYSRSRQSVSDPALIAAGQLSVGDKVSLTTTGDCQVGDAVVFPDDRLKYFGGLDFEVDAFEGDLRTDSYRLDARFDLGFFRDYDPGPGSGGSTIRFVNQFNGVIDTRVPQTLGIDITGDEMPVDQYDNQDFGSLVDYEFQVAGDFVGQTFTLEGSAGVEDFDRYISASGGVDLHFEVLDPLVMRVQSGVPNRGSYPVPASGSFSLLAEDGSSITVVHYPSNAVEISVDADGNGIAERVINTNF